MLGAELTAPPLDAAGQMALDEAVLLSAPPGAAILRIYRWAAEACTFGYSQPFSAARAACDARGWRGVLPVRRATGGGIVFHDGDLTFSLVFPWDRLLAPEAVYEKIHRGICAAVGALGAAARVWSSARRPLGAAAACFARAEPMDLVAGDGRKVLGGALRKKGAKGLYQGSLRTDLLGLPRSILEPAVADGVARGFGAASPDLEAAWLEAGRALEGRYRSADWNERR